mgnify:CR=1 FL=1
MHVGTHPVFGRKGEHLTLTVPITNGTLFEPDETFNITLSNPVGHMQTGRYGIVIPSFVPHALSGSPITVFGDGIHSRSFTYVSDVVGAMVRLMDSDQTLGQVYNIGNGKEITMLELARIVKEMTSSSSEIVLVPYDEAYEEGFEDMPRRVPDISKIRKAIGYEPTLGIRAILQKVIDYEKK